MLIWFLPTFLIFLLIGLPVFFALLAAPGILLWLSGQTNDITLLYRNVYNGMDSFPGRPCTCERAELDPVRWPFGLCRG